jgi:hypothetical protein
VESPIEGLEHHVARYEHERNRVGKVESPIEGLEPHNCRLYGLMMAVGKVESPIEGLERYLDRDNFLLSFRRKGGKPD